MSQSLQSLLTDTFALRRAWVLPGPEFDTDVLPLVYGNLEGGKGGVGYCPGIVEATNTYEMADHPILSQADGNSPLFYADLILMTPLSWTPSTMVAGRLCATVTFASSLAGTRVGWRGKGKANGATLLTNPIDVVVDFLTSHVGVYAEDIEPTAQADARARAERAGYKCAGVLDLDRSPATTISEILSCFGGYYYMSPAGKIVLVIDDGTTPSFPGIADHFPAQYFEGAEATWSRVDVVNQAAVSYAKNSYNVTLTQRYQEADDGVATKDTQSQLIHGPGGPGVTEPPLEFPWVRDAASVRTTQAVIVGRLGTPRARIRLQAPTYGPVHLDVGDYVGFSWPRLSDEQGQPLKNQIGIVEEIAIDGDTPKVDFTIRDTGAYLAQARRLDGTSKWGFTSLSGTVTKANTKISLSTVASFVDFNGAVGLTDYAGRGLSLTVTDAAGRRIVGPLGAMSTGETLDIELLSNGAFATDTVWTKTTGWTISTGKGRWNTDNQWRNFYQPHRCAAGVLGKYSFDLDSISAYGLRVFIDYSNEYPYQPGIFSAAGAGKTGYWTVQGGGDGNLTFQAPYEGATNGVIDNASWKQVLTPASTGAMVTWTTKEAGFNLNDPAGYTWQISGGDLWKLGADRDQRDY